MCAHTHTQTQGPFWLRAFSHRPAVESNRKTRGNQSASSCLLTGTKKQPLCKCNSVGFTDVPRICDPHDKRLRLFLLPRPLGLIVFTGESFHFVSLMNFWLCCRRRSEKFFTRTGHISRAHYWKLWRLRGEESPCPHLVSYSYFWCVFATMCVCAQRCLRSLPFTQPACLIISHWRNRLPEEKKGRQMLSPFLPFKKVFPQALKCTRLVHEVYWKSTQLPVNSAASESSSTCWATVAPGPGFDTLNNNVLFPVCFVWHTVIGTGETKFSMRAAVSCFLTRIYHNKIYLINISSVPHYVFFLFFFYRYGKIKLFLVSSTFSGVKTVLIWKTNILFIVLL